jgi:hypothetical protein
VNVRRIPAPTPDPLDASPIKRAILEVLRARGGRLWMVDLVFELRWRGATAEIVHRELDELVELRLVRGPLSRMLDFELTADGWNLPMRR